MKPHEQERWRPIDIRETLIHTVLEFLDNESTLTLATVGPDSLPATADLYFVANHELKLYFVSEPNTRHARNLKHNSKISATIHTKAWHWKEIRGVQICGICEPPSSPAESALALTLYGGKFRFVHTLSTIISRHTLYCITPTWLRWVDNRVSFGYKKEIWKPDCGKIRNE